MAMRVPDFALFWGDAFECHVMAVVVIRLALFPSQFGGNRRSPVAVEAIDFDYLRESGIVTKAMVRIVGNQERRHIGRQAKQVINKAIYLALGVNLQGHKDLQQSWPFLR
jgi:hypothetical protein